MSAGLVQRVLAQLRVELTLMVRNGENLLAMLAIPLGILVFFSAVDVLPGIRGRPVDFLLPGTVALAALATGMVTLSIGTAFDRQNGVLKRLGVTPLGRGGLLAAKVASVLVLVAGQAAVLGLAAVALGWRPGRGVGLAAALLALGTAAFAALGFLLAGTLRAEGTLAASNALFIALLLLGGVAVPVASLPGPVRAVAGALPVAPLTSAMRDALAGVAPPAGSIAVLVAWTVVPAAVAALTFRWE